MAMGGFPARPGADRNAFLVFTALVWVGILSGFGTDSFDHVSKHGLDYPLIVHVHAVTFVGWLVLFTVQVALIRNRRADLHRKLGVAGLILAVTMLVIGVTNVLIVDAARYVAKGETPEFLGVQFTDLIAFATLTGAGLLMRATPAAHKRLMLLALFYLSDAGFARFINGFLAAPFGDGAWGEMMQLYIGSDLLILGLGAYDLVTRRRLHPAYVAALGWIVVLQVTAYLLLHSDSWKALTIKMIGH